MDEVALLDLVAALAFAASALVVLARGRESIGRTPRRTLVAALAIYVFVGVSNLLEHAGVTGSLDPYEDYAELLFMPLALMFFHGVVAGREIRARAASERALRQSQEHYRTLVEGMDFGISLIGSDYRIIMVNPALERMHGMESGSLVGRPCYEVFARRDSVCPDCPGARAMAGEGSQEQEFGSTLPDGRRMEVRIRAFPIGGADGTPTSFLEVVEDVTGRKQEARERRRLEEQARQGQKLESLGVLAGGIAHDFNNILAGIVGNAELALLELPRGEAATRHVQQVDLLAQRAAELVNQLLAYAGRGSFSVQPVRLNDLVDEMVPLLKLSISKKAELRIVLAPDLPSVMADVTQLRQVLMNLVHNASEALGSDGGVIGLSTITVDADRGYLDRTLLGKDLEPGPYAALQVSDTGSGMEPVVVERIFDPFFTTKAAGRGLGLSAVLGIVRAHRGTLRIHSTAGKGTRIVLLFPSSGVAGAPTPRAAAEEGPQWRGQGTVLVVDDEDQVRSTAAKLLDALGFRVLTAADGLEGADLHRARHGEIDLVLLDMTMPRLDGPESLIAIRAVNPDAKVLIMTGYSPEEAATRFAATPPDGYLQKPFTLAKLREALRSVLEG